MKIVVIGNGFDLYHKLPTSYSDFRTYMNHNHPNQYIKLNDAIKEGFKNTESSKRSLFNEKVEWNKIELYLMALILKTDSQKEIYPIFNDFFKKYLNDVISPIIKDYKNCEIKSKKVEEKFKNTDLFINYNYTNTINLYNSNNKNVFYKHNAIHLNSDLPLITGHDVHVKTIKDHILEKKEIEKKLGEVRYSNEFRKSTTNSIFSDIKNSQDAAILYNDFFNNKDTKIDELVIIGHSLEYCDFNSLKKIFSKVTENTILNIYLYEPNISEMRRIKIRLLELNSKIDVEDDKIWSKYWDIDFSKYQELKELRKNKEI